MWNALAVAVYIPGKVINKWYRPFEVQARL